MNHAEFQLCFEFGERQDPHFLIPSLLPKEEPDLNWPADEECLCFKYHYDVLPNSIISRFIFQMHKYVSQHTYWRTGVVLSREGNKALIKGDTEERDVHIAIIGNPRTRREFLAIIRDRFEDIHQTLPGLSIKQQVPIPGHPGVFEDYDHLLNLEVLGETSFIPTGLSVKQDVKRLLDGIEAEQERQERRANGVFAERTNPQTEPPKLETGGKGDALALSTTIKVNLDQNAEASAKRNIALGVCLFIAIAIGFAIATYRFGWWDSLEPAISFISIILGLVGYLYFVLTQREINPRIIYSNIVESKKRKIYQAVGFDSEQYEHLMKHSTHPENINSQELLPTH